VFRQRHGIYSLDLTNGQLSRIAENAGNQLEVTAGGDVLAFDLHDQLYVVSVEGTGLQQVTNNQSGVISALSWSPDGSKLAYTVTSKPIEYASSSLWVWQLETKKDRQVDLGELRLISFGEVRWLPSSRHLLFLATGGEANSGQGPDEPADESNYIDLYQVDIKNQSLTNLTQGLGDVYDFYPSPDGTMVIVSTEAYNEEATQEAGISMRDFRVFLVNVDTGDVTEVLHRLLDSEEFTWNWRASPWSPDSEWVLLPSRVVRTDTLRAIRRDGTLHREIVDLAWEDQDEPSLYGYTATLSPDGRTIVGGGRLAERDNESLCAVDSDGGNFRILVADTLAVHPLWSPDSKSIFFQYTLKLGSFDERFGVVNVDGSGLFDPFANVSEPITYIEDVRWARSRPLVSTPTATPSPTATVAPVKTPDPSTCSVPGVVAAVVIAWWLVRRR
jgi:WD40 repeat protein